MELKSTLKLKENENKKKSLKFLLRRFNFEKRVGWIVKRKRNVEKGF